MKKLHQYVPGVNKSIEQDLGGEKIQVEEVIMHPILFGGDQLTAQRARAAKLSMAGESTSKERLEGLVPVIEDWHTKQALLVVSYVVVSNF